MSDWSAKNPYSSNLTENFVLNGEGSRKETRHIVFDLNIVIVAETTKSPHPFGHPANPLPEIEVVRTLIGQHPSTFPCPSLFSCIDTVP